MAQSGVRAALTTWARNYVVAPRYLAEQRLRLRTDDGVVLAAARITGADHPIGTIVLIHGFTNWSRTPRVHRFALDLARRTDVIVPDLRGHGRSGGRCSLGRDERRDVAAAVAAARPDLPVVTVGVSMGGVATLLHAGHDGGVAGTVAISAPAEWRGLTTHGASRVRRYAGTRSGRLALAALCRTRVLPGMPATLEGSAATIRAIAPAFTLLVHDRDDRYFPVEHAETLYRWAGSPKEIWWTEGAGHGVDLLTTELADRLVAFLADRLPPPSSPSP